MSMTRYAYGRRAKEDPSYLASLLERTINRLGILTADMDYVAEQLDEGNRDQALVLRSLDAATGATEAAKLLLIDAVKKFTATLQPRAVPPPQNYRPSPNHRPAPNRYRRHNHTPFDPLHGDQGNKS